MAVDAAERGSGTLVKAGLPVHFVTCSSGRETLGWEFDLVRPVVGLSRRGLWRLRVAMLHVGSLGWASEDEISSLVGHFTFRSLVRSSKLLSVRLTLSLNAGAVRDAACGCPSSVNFELSAPRCSEVSLLDASTWSGAVVAASIPVAVVKETGRCYDRWRFSCQHDFDAALRSVVEATFRRSAQRSIHQLSSSQSSPPIPRPTVLDVPCEI